MRTVPITLIGPERTTDLRWHGTSVALSVALGLLFTAVAAWLMRLALRLRRIRLLAGPGGVEVFGPRHDHRLRWDQIRAFTVGSARRGCRSPGPRACAWW